MTQPVQEPTPGRDQAATDFRTRQLFRRPSEALLWEDVGGSGYLGKGILNLSTISPTSIPSSSLTTFTWDEGTNTMGATTADNIIWAMPGDLPEWNIITMTIISLNQVPAGYTSPFAISCRGMGGYNGTGEDFVSLGPQLSNRENFVMMGIESSLNDNVQLQIWQTSGKTIPINYILFYAWYMAPSGY